MLSVLHSPVKFHRFRRTGFSFYPRIGQISLPSEISMDYGNCDQATRIGKAQSFYERSTFASIIDFTYPCQLRAGQHISSSVFIYCMTCPYFRTFWDFTCPFRLHQAIITCSVFHLSMCYPYELRSFHSLYRFRSTMPIATRPSFNWLNLHSVLDLYPHFAVLGDFTYRCHVRQGPLQPTAVVVINISM